MAEEKKEDVTENFLKWLENNPIDDRELEEMPSEILQNIIRQLIIFSSRTIGGSHQTGPDDPHTRCGWGKIPDDPHQRGRQ